MSSGCCSASTYLETELWMFPSWFHYHISSPWVPKDYYNGGKMIWNGSIFFQVPFWDYVSPSTKRPWGNELRTLRKITKALAIHQYFYGWGFYFHHERANTPTIRISFEGNVNICKALIILYTIYLSANSHPHLREVRVSYQCLWLISRDPGISLPTCAS